MTTMPPELAPLLQASTPHQREDVWPLSTTTTGVRPLSKFSVQRAPYTTDLQWNWASNLEPSGPKAEALPLGHRGLSICEGKIQDGRAISQPFCRD
ncbi:hypothetical protein AVEN_183416-1 [Araneus ventricosus]|uniref:Uncharacterized protein n=1 Tax=Araneus ventricosus TaxID=182803 RepID=A0A4Y2AK82_ARAVE|nr:hypothetical protein AVEN_4960-1 [Araneus ventricosus]GBL80168.1 hypothetical protein AVEN_132249-1 [Araneus ventricosus]GBL80196.1 hypothetical protein AVEN_163592-1 [Araneus ventricosus]GBL80200.1 hypothetical protein AVEN_183416-1 [Araneus ventricosus]